MRRMFLSLVLILATAHAAHATAITDEQRAQARTQMAVIAKRLELTDQQRAQVEPIVLASLEEQKTLLTKHGLDPSKRPSPRQLRALRNDMQALRQHTQAELEGVLSEEQLAEFSKIQEESRAQMRARMRGQR